MKLQWYNKMYAEAQKGIKLGNPECVHGSLIVLGIFFLVIFVLHMFIIFVCR